MSRIYIAGDFIFLISILSVAVTLLETLFCIVVLKLSSSIYVAGGLFSLSSILTVAFICWRPYLLK